MRVFLGFLVAAVALAAGLYLHSGAKLASFRYGTGMEVCNPSWSNSNCSWTKYATGHKHASWQDPLAVFLAVAGVGAGIAITLPAFRTLRQVGVSLGPDGETALQPTPRL